MTLEEAVAAPGRKVQIPVSEVKNGTRALLIYSVGSEGAHEIARSRVPEGEIDALVEDLKRRGIDVAETDLDSDATFVWIRKPDGVEIYDSNGKVFEAAAERATRQDGSSIARSDIARVIAYADGYVHHGVKIVLKSGEEVRVLMNVSGRAMGDPTYTRNELIFETGWTATTAIAIADWAGVEFVDEV